MKTAAFIGEEEQIRQVFADRQIGMRSRGMDTDTVLTRAYLEQHPDAAATVEYLFSTWGMPSFTVEEIRRYFPSLKAIFYAAGTVQSFAREFLACGVTVMSAWAANAVPVAELTLAEITLANKGFYGNSRLYKQNREPVAAGDYSRRFSGNFDVKVGIIGAGMIGRMVIERLRAMAVTVLVFDPFLPRETADELGVTLCDLPTLFRECETVSNHLANNPQTVGVLNYALFSQMKPYATFINTGRGAQVVEDDLIRALREEPGRTAVLDVTLPEPCEPDSPLFSLPNTVLTTHIAGSMCHEVVRMADYALEEYERYTAGLPLRYAVTEERLKTMA